MEVDHQDNQDSRLLFDHSLDRDVGEHPDGVGPFVLEDLVEDDTVRILAPDNAVVAAADSYFQEEAHTVHEGVGNFREDILDILVVGDAEAPEH